MSQRIEDIDNEILEHAEEIVRLMKLKGFKDDSKDFGVSFITINNWNDGIEVECQLQDIKTIRRKKEIGWMI